MALESEKYDIIPVSASRVFCRDCGMTSALCLGLRMEHDAEAWMTEHIKECPAETFDAFED